MPASVRFGGVVSLDGAQIQQTGGSLAVSLVWRIESAPPPDLTATIQLFDAAGAFVTNADGDIDGYPARVWIPDTTIADRRRSPCPPISRRDNTRWRLAGTRAAISRACR
ncbi:MAG: hypothetical protein HND48_00550 [Chloroflexi bacterium]|nr:hypothetical protein [Chloroflexota bacterium]